MIEVHTISNIRVKVLKKKSITQFTQKKKMAHYEGDALLFYVSI